MAKWKKAPEELVRLFKDLMTSFPEAEMRTMFGYPVAFSRGNMVCGLFEDSMLVRLPPGERDELMEKFDTTLFEPMPGRPMKEYVLIPPALLDDPERLVPWLSRGFAYARTLPRKAPKKKGRG